MKNGKKEEEKAITYKINDSTNIEINRILYDPILLQFSFS